MTCPSPTTQRGLGTLPLAPLADVTKDRLPEIVQRMRQRLGTDVVTDAEEAEFWTTTNILLGLRYSKTLAARVLKGVRRMKESVTYQAILQEGEAIGEARGETRGEARVRAQEARSVIMRLGRKRFGDPLAATVSAVKAISSVERLEVLQERLLEVESWDELLI